MRKWYTIDGIVYLCNCGDLLSSEECRMPCSVHPEKYTNKFYTINQITYFYTGNYSPVSEEEKSEESQELDEDVEGDDA